MKGYYKQCKNTKEVNSFLKKCNLDGWEFDKTYNFPEEFDFDSWINEEQTKGLSLQVSTNYEVFISKYTKKDIEKMESKTITGG